MVKIGHLDDSSLDIFLTPSKPGRRPITAAKRKAKEQRQQYQAHHIAIWG